MQITYIVYLTPSSSAKNEPLRLPTATVQPAWTGSVNEYGLLLSRSAVPVLLSPLKVEPAKPPPTRHLPARARQLVGERVRVAEVPAVRVFRSLVTIS